MRPVPDLVAWAIPVAAVVGAVVALAVLAWRHQLPLRSAVQLVAAIAVAAVFVYGMQALPIHDGPLPPPDVRGAFQR
jgi:hypothetical protein